MRKRLRLYLFQLFIAKNKAEIQTYRFTDAYPISYLSYNNIDFGTTKGLELKYDLRRVKNIKSHRHLLSSICKWYGFGSLHQVLTLTSSGEPNLQVPQALSYDQRHTINVDIDYHFSSGDYNGPILKSRSGKEIKVLENAGFNLSLTAGSGTPYTVQSNATEGNPGGNVVSGVVQHYGLVGNINGAYLPWHYRVDMKIDKEFPLIINKSKGEKAKHCSLLVYIQASNLLEY